MKFFVDYENVGSLGFRGAEYLSSEDEVVLFYSKTCQTLERGVLNRLYDSGCDFSLCKLERTGHNALDFYITSHIGEVLGKGYDGVIAIVSHDKGFRAIYDYWKARNPGMTIVCKQDIIHCILSSNENSIRRKQISTELAMEDVEKDFARFERRALLRTSLEEELGGSDREWHMDELAKSLVQRQVGRETYLSLMREYGIQDGQAIYRALKKVG